jgi:hypothetical protein
VVGRQNGESWSRGLPASWVMMVLATSTVFCRSHEHAVGIERRAVVGELRHPFGEPGLVGVGDLAGNGLGIFRALAVELLHLRDQALQHELSVARHTQRHGDVLVDVGGIERRLDDLGAWPAS